MGTKDSGPVPQSKKSLTQASLHGPGLTNVYTVYFQPVIATKVLGGLIYLIYELYIDDVLIDGADEDTFVNSVRQGFARFRKHKIIANPKKMLLGLEEVEYVGHLVSHKGISFTKEKRQKIQNFERPRTHKEMLMYVGLVNYS